MLTIVCNAQSQSEMSPIEIKGDRTIIYPQRMDLKGEESLMDILEMYPEMLVGGFDYMLDTYQLRLDNVPLNGNLRLLLTQTKACTIDKVQIVDNPGVAKGVTGMNGVIDINLLRQEKGVHGMAELQGSTDHSFAPTLHLKYGSNKTDIYANASYDYSEYDKNYQNRQYAHFEMTNYLSKKDKLLIYLSESNNKMSHLDFPYDNYYTKIGNRYQNYLARARYFHTFNDLGTELLILLGYQYQKNNIHNSINNNYFSKSIPTKQTPMYLVELNTPIVNNHITMMLGIEGDFNRCNYDYKYENTEDNLNSSNYLWNHIYNNDAYLQFNIQSEPWQLTIGDRVQMYHYKVNENYKFLRQNGLYSPVYNEFNGKDNQILNSFQASIILKLNEHHQFQTAYYRKYKYPYSEYSIPGINLQNNKNNEDDFVFQNGTIGNGIDQYKFAYTYSKKSFAANVAIDYYKAKEELLLYGKIATSTSNYYTVTPTIDRRDVLEIESSIYWKIGFMQLTSGISYFKRNFNIRRNMTETDGEIYSSFRICPTCR